MWLLAINIEAVLNAGFIYAQGLAGVLDHRLLVMFAGIVIIIPESWVALNQNIHSSVVFCR